MSARVVVIALLALAALSAGGAWLHERDTRIRAQATAAEQWRADSIEKAGLARQAATARARVDTAWAVETVTVARWRTVVESLPPVTVRESVYVAACGAVVTACETARDRARAALAAAQAEARHADSTIAHLRAATRDLVPRRSPCGWGLTLGPVATYAPDVAARVRLGVGAAAGLTCRF